VGRRAYDTLYLVERLHWSAMYGQAALPASGELPPGWRRNPFLPGQCFVPFRKRSEGAGGYPERAFLDHDRAAAYCRRREREARAGANPFRHGERVADWSSLDHDRLHDWLLDAGIDPPVAGERSRPDPWRAWWDLCQDQLTELQREKVWEALDKVRFFRVVELAAGG
jgi:hypothetical protein